MAARFERKEHDPEVPIWVGKYRNLHNLPHWHIEHELIACRDGEAVVTMDGIPLHLSPGTAVFCHSGSIHHVEAQEDCTLLVAQVAPELVDFLGNIRLKARAVPDQYRIYDTIDGILAELKDQKPYYSQRVQAMLVQIFIDVFRNEETFLTEDNSRSNQIASQYRELLSRIDRESEFLTFSEAAAGMHMSEAHFSRFFKSYTGMTFSKYLNLVKIDKAVTILKEEPSISTSDLALRCGFNTLRTFNRVFSSVTGFTPKQLPPDFSLEIRQYAVTLDSFDPTLGNTVPL